MIGKHYITQSKHKSSLMIVASYTETSQSHDHELNISSLTVKESPVDLSQRGVLAVQIKFT